MKFYRVIFFFMLVFVCQATYAQLLERNNVTSRIAVGTRPQQGDFGFLLGLSTEELREMIDKSVNIRALPLMSFKYYVTDNIEVRLNTQSYGKSKSILGTLVNQVGTEDQVEKESYVRFLPNVQYHFASSNLLDTYAGIGVIVGSERNDVLTTDKTTVTGDYVATKLSKKTFVTGFNIDFGVQAFIADLPLSIGAEVSVRGLKHSNLQYDNTFSSSVGGVVTNQNYFTIDKTSTLKYQSLEYKTFSFGADLRVNFSYYFRR